MATLSLYSQPSQIPSRVSPNGEDADDEGVSDSSYSTSNWSELVSPDHSSYEG